MNLIHCYSGKITVIDVWNETDEIVDRKLHEIESVFSAAISVGLDLEWSPDGLRPGEYSDDVHGNPVALIQLAITDHVLVLRTPPKYSLPIWIRDILESKQVEKITVGYDTCDVGKLKSSFGLSIPRSSVCDLSDMSRENGIAQRGFKSICFYFNLFPKKSHRIAISAWGEAEALSPAQVSYAAEDAWFCLLLAAKLRKQPTESLEEFLIVKNKSEVGVKRKRENGDKRCERRDRFLKIGTLRFTPEHGIFLRESEIEDIIILHPVGSWIPEHSIANELAFRMHSDIENSFDRESWLKVLTFIASHVPPDIEIAWDGDISESMFRHRKHPQAASALQLEKRVSEIFGNHSADYSGIEFIQADSKEADEFYYRIVAKLKQEIDTTNGRCDDITAYRRGELSRFIRSIRLANEPVYKTHVPHPLFVEMQKREAKRLQQKDDALFSSVFDVLAQGLV